MRPWQLLSLVSVLLLRTPFALAAEVIVITDASHPVSDVPPQAKVVRLDEPATILKNVQTLSPEPQVAARTAEQQLLKRTQPLHPRLAAAYQGVVYAWSMGISHVPAVVVDRKYVVYGEHNVSTALRRIETYRGSKQ